MLYSSGLTHEGILLYPSLKKHNQYWHHLTEQEQGSSVCRSCKSQRGNEGFQRYYKPLSKVTSKTLNLWSPGVRTWHFYSEISLLLYLQFYKYIWVSKHQTIHKSKLSRFSTFASMFVCKVRNSIIKFSYFIPKCQYL